MTIIIDIIKNYKILTSLMPDQLITHVNLRFILEETHADKNNDGSHFFQKFT